MTQWIAVFWQRIGSLLSGSELRRIFGLTVLVLLVGTIGLAVFEHESLGLKNPIWDGLWWSVVTMTTVGYGDISPATVPGRLVALGVMVFGIGLVGLAFGAIASALVERKLREARGLVNVDKMRGHFVVLGWNSRAPEVVQELLASRSVTGADIAVLAPLETSPVRSEEHVYFLKGDPTVEDDLRRVGIDRARAALILAREGDAAAADAQAVLTALAVESVCPSVYTCVELIDPNNVRHCLRAKANEIVVSGELRSRLLSGAALNPGISRFFGDLISAQTQTRVFTFDLPGRFVGGRFFALFVELKEKHALTVLAIARGETFHTNPEPGFALQAGDRIVAMGTEPYREEVPAGA